MTENEPKYEETSKQGLSWATLAGKDVQPHQPLAKHK